jgi:NADP-dependent 3-hydroxy acid dehydrogenase YdfG
VPKQRPHFLQPYPPTVAMVTGASRGIGAAIARALAGIGLDLVLTSTRAGGTKTVANACRQLGVEVLELAHDAASRADAERICKAATKKFGRVDILVNNAGRALGAPFEKTDGALWSDMLASNLSSVFFCHACRSAGHGAARSRPYYQRRVDGGAYRLRLCFGLCCRKTRRGRADARARA